MSASVRPGCTPPVCLVPLSDFTPSYHLSDRPCASHMIDQCPVSERRSDNVPGQAYHQVCQNQTDCEPAIALEACALHALKAALVSFLPVAGDKTGRRRAIVRIEARRHKVRPRVRTVRQNGVLILYCAAYLCEESMTKIPPKCMRWRTAISSKHTSIRLGGCDAIRYPNTSRHCIRLDARHTRRPACQNSSNYSKEQWDRRM